MIPTPAELMRVKAAALSAEAERLRGIAAQANALLLPLDEMGKDDVDQILKSTTWEQSALMAGLSAELRKLPPEKRLEALTEITAIAVEAQKRKGNQ